MIKDWDERILSIKARIRLKFTPSGNFRVEAHVHIVQCVKIIRVFTLMEDMIVRPSNKYNKHLLNFLMILRSLITCHIRSFFICSLYDHPYFAPSRRFSLVLTKAFVPYTLKFNALDLE